MSGEHHNGPPVQGPSWSGGKYIKREYVQCTFSHHFQNVLWGLHGFIPQLKPSFQYGVTAIQLCNYQALQLTQQWLNCSMCTYSRKDPSPALLHLCLTPSSSTCTALPPGLSLSLRKQPHQATTSSGPAVDVGDSCLRRE